MDSIRAEGQPFALRPTAGSGWSRFALGVGAAALERTLGLTALAEMYAEATGPTLVEDFPERALDYLGIRWAITPDERRRIPANGPLVVVANHPFGAVDGLVLLAMLRTVRSDVRLLGNYVLERIPELRPLIFPVDPFGGPRANASNSLMLRRAADWTRRGGAAIVFPAGEVSAVRAAGGSLVDDRWHRGVARLAAAAQASVLPVFFDGRNSRWFELAGRFHARLRTALLPRELLRRRKSTIEMRVGELVPYARLASQPSAASLTADLRARTYALRGDNQPRAAAVRRGTRVAEAAAPIPASALVGEVAALPSGHCLVEHGDYQVWYAAAARAPSVLNEIGRLREVAFRAVGEGTGLARDLDVFDRRYWHLFVWNRARAEVVGAYRLGPTDAIAAAQGARGLYTRTLFKYGPSFLRRLGPALELGRSFVRLEYQREFSALMLLWKGIGRFTARHPRYRRLFGPVSISAAYRSTSRDLIVGLLNQPAYRSQLHPLVRPRFPYLPSGGVDPGPLTALDLAHVDRLVSDIESDGKGVPVLLRQYLKLNAEVLGFNVDASFAGVVDALMVVDLASVDAPILGRYMGREAAQSFLAATDSHLGRR